MKGGNLLITSTSTKAVKFQRFNFLFKKNTLEGAHPHTLKTVLTRDYNKDLSFNMPKGTLLYSHWQNHWSTPPRGKKWRGWKSLAYLVYEYIDWNIQGASLSVYHGDESKSHSHIEPLTVASSVQNLGFLLCLLRQLPGLFSTTFACPAWVEQDKKKKKSQSVCIATVHGKRG